jgi:hypothetical protein
VPFSNRVGKESGEIEYAGDSVSVLARVPGTWKDGASDVLFITAKGRATGPTWSPLHFTRWGYREADDGGSFAIAAMKAAADGGRKAKRAAKAFEAESKTKAEAEAKAAKAAKQEADKRCRWDASATPSW